jgi:hypothetical protein
MKNLQVNSSIYALVIVSAIAWFTLAWLSELDLSAAASFFSLIPKVVTCDLLLVLVFTKWGWKWKAFRGWLVPFPNLNGTWTGNIYSDWINPESGEGVPPIPVMLAINQSFFHINCKMMTGEMESFSTSEGFNIDPDKQIKQLAYIYTSKPRISLNQRSVPHEGSIVFDIIEIPSRKLKGRYWTERKTLGEIILTQYSPNILEDLPENFNKHPITEEKNLR